MGKYMRKVKRTREVAAAEPAGVRTRARALAMQKTEILESSRYLQLRSRRLEKKVAPLVCGGGGVKENKEEGHPKGRSEGEVEGNLEEKKEALGAGKEEEEESVEQSFGDLGVQASFGENVLEIEGGGDRSTRETTPCSLIRTSDALETPGSTTRRRISTATNSRIQNGTPRTIPTSQELEEFFADAEQDQIRIFIEKYNFDPMTETPLPGRFEWEKLDP